MNFIISHVPPRRGMATNGSDSHSETGENSYDRVEAIDDKWTVEDLKEYLRRRGGRVSSIKAALIERFALVTLAKHELN